MAYALAAYGFWGLAPIYFVWVGFALPVEILAHRIVWSIPLLALLITLNRQWIALFALTRVQLGWLFVCAALLCVNWLTFIYAIADQNIAETSLGYFINPLVSIVLGALVLGERMRAWQWLAALIAAAGVGVELIMLGRLPIYALLLASSFGLYGLIRRHVQLPSTVGLGVETAFVVPLASAYLFFLYAPETQLSREISDYAMLALGGVVTVVPLIWFGAAAVRLPLSMLGFIQYLAPSMSLVIAVLLYDEVVAGPRWLAFVLIWLALVIFSLEGLYAQRRGALHKI
jgi:chloramphenicol-sensitive protein RarD